MDNLTHSLAGALLGQMGLKRLTGRAMATLIIAANIPDLDAVTMIASDQSLAIRRGITHGPVAMLVLPLLLTGLVLAWDRWRPARDPVRPAHLLLLAYIGTLSHPALDWLNSYGIRLLEPFSSRWFAGDTLFIIDVWVWGALILSFGLSRWRERRGGDWRRPAWIGFAAIGAYIFANGLLTGHAERLAETQLRGRGIAPALVVANPQPLHFWERRMLWRDELTHGDGRYRLGEGVRLSGRRDPIGLSDPRLAAIADRPDVAAFLFWSRMPILADDPAGAVLTDQRFHDPGPNPVGTSIRYDPFVIPLE